MDEENDQINSILTKEMRDFAHSTSTFDNLTISSSLSGCISIPSGSVSNNSIYTIPTGSLGNISSISGSVYYPKIDIKSLSSENIPEGAILTVGKGGEVVWSNCLPGIETIVSNPGLSAAFEKLIQAYQEFKMMERLSKEE